MDFLFILLVIVGLIAMYVASTYNKLIQRRNMTQDQWAQVDVFLKRRADLIPNLVETVKGYASHEKETFDAVITARNRVVSAPSAEAEMQANGELTATLGRLFALAEAYPDLKANTNFLDLQANLKETEDKISYARQFYNDAVLQYRNLMQVFPSNIVASMFKFENMPFFEATENEKVAPQVKF